MLTRHLSKAPGVPSTELGGRKGPLSYLSEGVGRSKIAKLIRKQKN